MTKTNFEKMIEWKTQTNISGEQWEILKTRAHTDFSPKEMMNYLAKSTDGTVYVDRSKMIHSKEQEQQFYYMLKRDFIAVWRDIENLTAYFEVISEEEIISGTYNILTGEKVSKRVLISNDPERAPYIYPAQDIEIFKEKIRTAPNASQRAK